MTETHRKHVVFPDHVLRFLERYQREHGLPSFSATIEAATKALEQQERRDAYARYAQDYASDPQAQAEAEQWLEFPMQEHPQDIQ
ncbi:hypothetical protein [Deinococcus koreensis]|nr:hypothetical protein [Deinococcus koreensis]